MELVYDHAQCWTLCVVIRMFYLGKYPLYFDGIWNRRLNVFSVLIGPALHRAKNLALSVFWNDRHKTWYDIKYRFTAFLWNIFVRDKYLMKENSKINYLSYSLRNWWRGLINYAYAVGNHKTIQREINLRDNTNWKSRRLNFYRFLYEKAFQLLGDFYKEL